jgi:paraquat-inducible protein A
LALTALILFVPGILLPVFRVEKLGHLKEHSLVTGVIELFSEGEILVAAIVLICSMLIPPSKLVLLLLLGFVSGARRRAAFYRLVELINRWGMLDVLLVAILVAFVKLGNLMEITPGPGLAVFTFCVLLSLASSCAFDRRDLWEEDHGV